MSKHRACPKCGKPRTRASLHARDVAEIVERFYRGKLDLPRGALRCASCKTIWLMFDRKPKVSPNVKKSRYTAGEIRFRTAKQDQERIDWLLANHPDQTTTISALIRILILREYERLQPKTTTH